MQTFAAADIHNVRVGGGDSDGSDGAGGLLVEDGLPGAPVIVGLPDAAVDRANVEDVGLAGHAGVGAGAAPAEGADVAPAHLAKRLGVNVLGLGLVSGGDSEQEEAQER